MVLIHNISYGFRNTQAIDSNIYMYSLGSAGYLDSNFQNDWLHFAASYLNHRPYFETNLERSGILLDSKPEKSINMRIKIDKTSRLDSNLGGVYDE